MVIQTIYSILNESANEKKKLTKTKLYLNPLELSRFHRLIHWYAKKSNYLPGEIVSRLPGLIFLVLVQCWTVDPVKIK